MKCVELEYTAYLVLVNTYIHSRSSQGEEPSHHPRHLPVPIPLILVVVCEPQGSQTKGSLV
jgi:hypothetical protein